MKIFFFLVLVCFTLLSFSSQSQVITWQKEYRGPDNLAGKAVTQMYDEGYVLCGFRYAGANIKFHIIRTNKFGDTLWAKDYPGLWPTKVIQTRDSNFVVCGNIQDSSGFSLNCYLLKINRNSTILWAKQFDGKEDNNCRDIYETADGKLSMIGTQTVSLIPPVSSNMFFVQTDKDGNALHIRQYDSTGEGLTIDEIPGKGFLLSGTSTLITTYSGEIIEEYRNYGSRGALSSIGGDGYVFIQRFDTTMAQEAVKLVKTDKMLNVIWTKTLFNTQRNIYANDFIKSSNSYSVPGKL